MCACTSSGLDGMLTEEQNWRGNVKSQLFVVTLQDYFRDQFEFALSTTGSKVLASDEWTLKYLDLEWLQPIMEAFDDDGSGYVTISEVNRLIDLRPLSLSWR